MTPLDDDYTPGDVLREALIVAVAVLLVALSGWMLSHMPEPPSPRTWRESAQAPRLSDPEVEQLLRQARAARVVAAEVRP